MGVTSAGFLVIVTEYLTQATSRGFLLAQDVRDKVHHGAVTVAPAEGGWSHCTPSQEAEAGDCR